MLWLKAFWSKRSAKGFNWDTNVGVGGQSSDRRGWITVLQSHSRDSNVAGKLRIRFLLPPVFFVGLNPATL